jgi:hypothetical protein
MGQSEGITHAIIDLPQQIIEMTSHEILNLAGDLIGFVTESFYSCIVCLKIIVSHKIIGKVEPYSVTILGDDLLEPLRD